MESTESSAADRKARLCPGQRQSPIDIDPAAFERVRGHGALPPVEFAYAERARLSRVDILGTAGDRFGTVRVTVAHGGGSVRLDGEVYPLRQFHWHVPAEHTLGGHAFPLEMHLVHQKPTAKGMEDLVVVGVWMEPGRRHAELERIFSGLPRLGVTGRVADPIEGFDLRSLLPVTRSSYRYPGSLTAPTAPDQEIFPETVEWILFHERIPVSAEQLRAFRALFPEGNARAVQPLAGRTIRTDVADGTLPPGAETGA